MSGNHAYVADRHYGLQVIDVGDPANPVRVGGYDTPGIAYDVAVSGDFAYVADDQAGLQVLDVSDPAHPMRVGSYDTSGSAQSVAVRGSQIFVADGNWGLMILQIPLIAPRLEGPVSLDAAGFHLLLQAGSGQSVRLQRSTNLMTWEDWQEVTGTGSPQPLTDGSASGKPAGFYRAVTP